MAISHLELCKRLRYRLLLSIREAKGTASRGMNSWFATIAGSFLIRVFIGLSIFQLLSLIIH